MVMALAMDSGMALAMDSVMVLATAVGMVTVTINIDSARAVLLKSARA